MAAIIGTASTVPHGPQIHVHTSTPMNTTTCMRSARPEQQRQQHPSFDRGDRQRERRDFERDERLAELQERNAEEAA